MSIADTAQRAMPLARVGLPDVAGSRGYRAALWNDPCAYCGVPLRRGNGSTLDHIVPRVRRGENTSGNLTAACGPCNSRKGSQSLLSYLLARA